MEEVSIINPDVNITTSSKASSSGDPSLKKQKSTRKKKTVRAADASADTRPGTAVAVPNENMKKKKKKKTSSGTASKKKTTTKKKGGQLSTNGSAKKPVKAMPKKKKPSESASELSTSQHSATSNVLEELQQTKLNYRQTSIDSTSHSLTTATTETTGKREIGRNDDPKRKPRGPSTTTTTTTNNDNSTSQGPPPPAEPLAAGQHMTMPGALRVFVNHIRPSLNTADTGPGPLVTEESLNNNTTIRDESSAPMIQAELVQEVRTVEAQLLEDPSSEKLGHGAAFHSKSSGGDDDGVFEDEEAAITKEQWKTKRQGGEASRGSDRFSFLSSTTGMAVACCCCLVIIVVIVVVALLVTNGGNDNGGGNGSNATAVGTDTISPTKSPANNQNQPPSLSPIRNEDDNNNNGNEDIFVTPTKEPTNPPTNRPTRSPNPPPTESCIVRVTQVDTGEETIYTGLEYANRYNGIGWTNATTEIVRIDDEQVEVPVLAHLDCGQVGDTISSACGSRTENWMNQDVSIENCPHVTCRGHGAACHGSTINRSSYVDCNHWNECANAFITEVQGPNAEVLCQGRFACDNAVITAAPETSGMKVTCFNWKACQNTFIEAGQEGVILCKGSDRGVACQAGTTMSGKCLICHPPYEYRNGKPATAGCGSGLTFNGISVPATMSGYCGDCSGVPEAEGLANICT